VEQPPDEQDLPTTPNFATQDPEGIQALALIYFGSPAYMRSWAQSLNRMSYNVGSLVIDGDIDWGCQQWCQAFAEAAKRVR
jgi:hypothetical protein